MSLKNQTVQGLAWVALSTIIKKFLSFATQIVLARLLTPGDFGLIAIGLLAINTMGLFRDLGFGVALIHKKDDSNHTAANTAFVILPFVALILVLIAYFSAPYIALFFDNGIVEHMVQVLALTFVISSFGTVPSILLEKELEFKKKVIPETVPIVGYACFTILLALKGYGIWSLVYGQIVSAILTAGSIWIVSAWRPTFKFDSKAAKELFAYGKHVISGTIIIFIITNIDDAIVGRILGSEALGFYTMAFLISNLPATQITHIISRVMFPTYSKLQDNKDALRNAYMKTLNYISTLTIPASLGILVIGPELINVILGEKWAPSIVALQVLCIFGLLRSIGATCGPIFQATGNPIILRNSGILKLLLFLVMVFPLTINYGILGMSLATTLPVLITIIFELLMVSKIIGIKFNVIITVFLIPLVNSLIMMSIIQYSKKTMVVNSVFTLSLIVLLGIFVYGCLFIFTNKKMVSEIKLILFNNYINP